MIKKYFEITIVGDVEDVSCTAEMIMDAVVTTDLASYEVICNSVKVEEIDVNA